MSEQTMSLSLRRAWIEIHPQPVSHQYCGTSLSLRRAWIEMLRFKILRDSITVALLTESVD